jgi:hypothetical protein
VVGIIERSFAPQSYGCTERPKIRPERVLVLAEVTEMLALTVLADDRCKEHYRAMTTSAPGSGRHMT